MNSKTVVIFIQSAQKGCLVRLKFEKNMRFFFLGGGGMLILVMARSWALQVSINSL